MANVKISQLTALTPPDAADLVPVTDTDASETKRTTVGEIVGIITGDVEVATDGTATISELPVSKLQDGAARQLLQTAANGTDVEWTDDVDLPGTLDVTGVTTLDNALNVAGLASLDGGIDVDGAFTVANTSGNIATSGTLGVTGQSTLASAAVSDLTADRVVVAGTSGELEDSANLTFDGSELGVTGTLDVSSNATIGGDLTVTGDLTVEGATTTLETQTVTVEDKNIELGVVDTPSDTTADGGGITLKGATDKTINWVNATDAWTFSEHVELASGKEFYIDGNGVLNATTLGSGVVNSSLTSVGTIATGTWEGTAIDAAYLDPTVVTTSDTGTVTSAMISDGTIVNADINASAAIADTKLDTISTAGKVSNSATTATDANTASAIVARDASGDFTAGTITADLTGNADTATKLDSSRTFEVTGDVTGTVSSDLTSGASIATSIASGVIVNADVSASAAIAGTKIDPDFGSQTVETTGVFSAAGGSAATPSIAFTGDLDTGIYSPGANQLAISTNGTGRLFIASDGKVGVGTTSPGNELSVIGVANATTGFTVGSEDGNTSGGLYNAGSTSNSISIIADPDNVGANSRISFFVDSNTTEAARIDDSGRLLVGTSSTATSGDSASAKIQIQANTSTATGDALISLQRGQAAASISSGSPLGKILFADNAGNEYGSIQCRTDGSSGSGDYPGKLVFSVTADGASTPTEALRISNDRSITVSDGGDVVLGTTTGTKIGTATSQKIGFYNATPVVQPTAVADITTTATSGSLPTPDGSVTIADAATPTVTELLEYCVELEAKLEAALGHLRTLGLIAT